MRYEVYGIYAPMGANYLVGVTKSLKTAIALADTGVNKVNCKAYAILVKERAQSYPSSIMTGMVGGPLLRDTSLMMPNPKFGNPITNARDAANWQGQLCTGKDT